MAISIFFNLIGKLSLPARLSRKDILLTIIPTLIWMGAHLSRPYILKTPCLENGAICSESNLPSVDRLVVHLDNENANKWSTWTQNASGAIAAVVPIGLQIARIATGFVSPVGALAAIGVDLGLLIETTLWNGAIMESFRVLVQRPRPFVYRDPIGAAGAPAHYTSFYSGHTSFAAAAMTALLLILISRGASPLWTVPVATSAFIMTFFTGFFRVWAGKHFITDVVTGAIAGFLVALTIALVHRPKLSDRN